MTTWDDCITAIAELPACLPHEEAVAKQPYSVAAWISYLDTLDEMLLPHPTATTSTKADSTDPTAPTEIKKIRDFVGRRAVQHLPRSYKLWKRQWEFVLATSKSVQQVVACFEQALVTCSHFPRVWMVYLQFLLQHVDQFPVTLVRRTMNRALQALPVPQHVEKLWKPILLPWLQTNNDTPVETRACLLQRYSQLQPSFLSEWATWCQQHGQPGRAAVAHQTLLLDSSQQQEEETWQAFGELCSQHSLRVEAAGIPWEAVLRTALKAAQQQQTAHKKTRQDEITTDAYTKPSLLEGMIYSWLANAWVRRGSFDLARSVYEEGLVNVTTVRDFSLLYEAYLSLEEGLLEHAVASLQEEEEEEQAEETTDTATDDNDWDILLETTATSQLTDMEMALARAEHLTRRRPLLLNQVMLRQNPNNVTEWLHRADLYLEQGQTGQAANALEQALQTVQQRPTGGSRSDLVVKLVKIYSSQNVNQARDLLKRMCQPLDGQPALMTVADDLATCWATWIELELEQEQWDTALSLARQSVAPHGKRRRKDVPNLVRNLRLWDLLLDLEESLGTVQTTKDAYIRALEIKAATVQHVLNYASFLKEHKYFEESFAAYERGIELFPFPHAGAKLLWKAYIKAFLDRYKGTKVERVRDLFQRCLEHCPAGECAEFCMMDGEFEEEYGLTKRALSVYHEMCQKVPASEKLNAYQLYAIKTTKYLGMTATRDIYQEAIESLEDQAASKMCLEFAKMETSLQQIERARGVLNYGAQMADPRRLPEYWKTWNDFEIAHGNEETFREMLRVKRSVETAFSTVNYNATGMSETVDTMSQEEAMRMIAGQEGIDIDEVPKTGVAGFVPSKRPAQAASLDDVEERVAKLRKVTGAGEKEAPAAANDDDDEIDIDEIDAEIEEAAAEGAAATVQEVSTKTVPAAVFGGLANLASTEQSQDKGALDRIRAGTK